MWNFAVEEHHHSKQMFPRATACDRRDGLVGLSSAPETIASTSVYYRLGTGASLQDWHSFTNHTDYCVNCSSCFLERSKSRIRPRRAFSRRKGSCSGTRCGTSRAGHTSCIAQGTQASACKVMMKLALSTPHHALKNLAKGPLTRPNNFMMTRKYHALGIRKESIRTNARS